MLYLLLYLLQVALTLVLVSFDSETGSFSQTLDVESAPLESKDLPHHVVLSPVFPNKT
jgi:hypothetical protein